MGKGQNERGQKRRLNGRTAASSRFETHAPQSPSTEPGHIPQYLPPPLPPSADHHSHHYPRKPCDVTVTITATATDPNAALASSTFPPSTSSPSL